MVYELSKYTNPITAPFKAKEDIQKLKSSYGALKNISDEDIETYSALMNDADTYALLMDFAKDYTTAQHPLEITEAGGMAAFEVALIVLTMGGGAVASVRHLGKLKKLKPLLDDLVKLLKWKRVKKNKSGGTNTKLETKNEVKSNEIGSRKTKKRKPRAPSKDNPNINHSKTTKNTDGSITYHDKKGNNVTYNKDGYPNFSKYA